MTTEKQTMTRRSPAQIDQELRIKALLARRRPRENLTSLARNLDLPYGTVAGTVYGYKRNPQVQAAIAGYFGLEKVDLFGDNGEMEAKAS